MDPGIFILDIELLDEIGHQNILVFRFKIFSKKIILSYEFNWRISITTWPNIILC